MINSEKGNARKSVRGGKAVMFGNQEKYTCGGTSQVEIMNPDEDDVKKSIVLMKTLSGL